MSAYGIVLNPDDNETILVTCPAFPEVTSFGEDEAACRVSGRLAIEEAIAARIKAGVDVPAPDGGVAAGVAGPLAVATPLLIELKIDLYRALRSSGVTRAELARRLGWSRTSVDRLFDTNHASRLEQIEAAIEALGYRIDAQIVALETA
jgi:antitoxin HicB